MTRDATWQNERLTPAQVRLVKSLREEGVDETGSRSWVELLHGESRTAKALQAKGFVEIHGDGHDVRLTSLALALPEKMGGAVPPDDSAERIAADLAALNAFDELGEDEDPPSIDEFIVRARRVDLW